MFLIIISVLFGFIGFVIGGAIGQDTLAFLLGFIGFTSPGLYVLQKVYEEVASKNNSDKKDSDDGK